MSSLTWWAIAYAAVATIFWLWGRRRRPDPRLLWEPPETPEEHYAKQQEALRKVKQCPHCGFRHVGDCRMVGRRGQGSDP